MNSRQEIEGMIATEAIEGDFRHPNIPERRRRKKVVFRFEEDRGFVQRHPEVTAGYLPVTCLNDKGEKRIVFIPVL